jgi:hypothetical protein
MRGLNAVMLKKRVAAIICAASVGSFASTAGAQSPADELTKSGLIGRWAKDCARPPSPTNQYAIFELATGASGSALPTYRFEVGDTNFRIAYRVEYVKSIAPDKAAWRIRKILPTPDSDDGFDVIAARKAEKMRTISSVHTSGTVFVRDGIEMSTQRETGWLSRCDTPGG